MQRNHVSYATRCSMSQSTTRKADGATRPVGCHRVLAHLLFNVYPSNQPLPKRMQQVYLCGWPIPGNTAAWLPRSLVNPGLNGLSGMSAYYLENHLHPDPGKNRICSFRLKNREAKWELNITWEGMKLIKQVGYSKVYWEGYLPNNSSDVTIMPWIEPAVHVYWPCSG